MTFSRTIVCSCIAAALCASVAFGQNRTGGNNTDPAQQGQQGQGGFGQGGQGGGPGGGGQGQGWGGGGQGGFGQGGGAQGQGPGGGGQGGFGQGGFGGPGGGRGGMGGMGGGMGGMGGFGGVTDPTNEMARVLTDLTDDQKTKLHSSVQASQQTLQDMRTAEAAKMQELWQGGDQQAIQDEMASAQKDQAELQAKSTAELEGILTPDQKNAWVGYQLAKLIKTRLASAVLTKDEVDKIEVMAKAAGKDIGAAKDTDAKNKIYGTIFKKVIDTVITDDQAGKVVAATLVRQGG